MKFCMADSSARLLPLGASVRPMPRFQAEPVLCFGAELPRSRCDVCIDTITAISDERDGSTFLGTSADDLHLA
jgi:hypothetical protein